MAPNGTEWHRMTMSERITFAELGRRIGYSKRQIIRWVEAEKLTPRTNPGGRKFFTVEDAEEIKRKIASGEFK